MSWLEFIDSLVSSLAWPAAVVLAVFVLRERLNSLLDRVQNVEAMGVKATFSRDASSIKAKVEGMQLKETASTLKAEAESEESTDVGHDGRHDEQTEDTGPRPSMPTLDDEPPSTPPSQDLDLSERAKQHQDIKRFWFNEVDESIAEIQDLGGEVRLSPAANIGLVVAAWAQVEAVLRGAYRLVDLPQAERRRPAPAVIRALAEHGAISTSQEASLMELCRLRNEAAHSTNRVSDQAAQDYISASVGVLQLVKSSVTRVL